MDRDAFLFARIPYALVHVSKDPASFQFPTVDVMGNIKFKVTPEYEFGRYRKGVAEKSFLLEYTAELMHRRVRAKVMSSYGVENAL